MKLKIIYITPFQDSLLINIFPWKKISKIHEHPIAQTPTPTILITDLTTIHLTLINLRISNIETNMRTRQISLPPSLPHPPRCPSLETSDVHDGNGFRKKNTVYRVSPPLLLLPISFFLRKPLRREISSVTTRTRRATNILYLITISTSGGQ